MASIARHTRRRYLKDEDGHPIIDPGTGKPAWEPAGDVWRLRYEDPNTGKMRARHYPRKVDAQRALDEITAAVVTGQYVDPRAGTMTFRAYAEDWRDLQGHRPGTRELVARHLTRYVYPSLGAMPLGKVEPGHVRRMLRDLEGLGLAETTRAVTWRFVQTIFRTAVRERRIPTSPCDGVKGPKVTRAKAAPVSTETVQAIARAIPDRYRALVILAAGTGLRQGEAFGLTVDRVQGLSPTDTTAYLVRRVRVDRQMTTSTGQGPHFAPLKTKASDRAVPLPDVVAVALAEHVERHGTGPDGLLFTNEYGRPLRRSTFGDVWRRAVKTADAEGVTFHALRHYYASLLIRRGASVKTVQGCLGHASAQETLDTYSHLWPDADEQTRAAIDAELGVPSPGDSRGTLAGGDAR